MQFAFWGGVSWLTNRVNFYFKMTLRATSQQIHCPRLCDWYQSELTNLKMRCKALRNNRYLCMVVDYFIIRFETQRIASLWYFFTYQNETQSIASLRIILSKVAIPIDIVKRTGCFISWRTKLLVCYQGLLECWQGFFVCWLCLLVCWQS